MTATTPILHPAVQRMLGDRSLSDTARVLGMFIASLGDDWHELSPQQFALVAHGYPTKDTIARHLRQTELAGYVQRKSGGRGHSDRFRFVFSAEKNPGANSDAPDRARKNPGPNQADPAPEPIAPGNTPALKIEPGNTPVLSALTRDEVGSQRESERESSTPSVVSPTAAELDGRAEDAIAQHNGLLDGCRDALRDYLATRVQPEKQYGYVQRIATVMNGLGFNWNPLGIDHGIPPPERPGLVAAALNELLATGERNADRPTKWADGDPRNLLNKLEILIKQTQGADGHGRRHHGGGTAAAVGGAAARSGGTARGEPGRRSAFKYE